MENKFAKCEWNVKTFNHISGEIFIMQGDDPLARVAINNYSTEEEAQANAKLIASAPELLEALQACMSELYTIHSQYGDKQNAIDKSYALEISEKAINKALK